MAYDLTDIRCRDSVDISPYLRAAAFARRLARLEVVSGSGHTPGSKRAQSPLVTVVQLCEVSRA